MEISELLLTDLVKVDCDSIGLPNKPTFSAFVSLAALVEVKDPSELDPNTFDTVWLMPALCEVSKREKAELVTVGNFCKLLSADEKKTLTLSVPDAKDLLGTLLLVPKAFFENTDDPV